MRTSGSVLMIFFPLESDKSDSEHRLFENVLVSLLFGSNETQKDLKTEVPAQETWRRSLFVVADKMPKHATNIASTQGSRDLSIHA